MRKTVLDLGSTSGQSELVTKQNH